MEDNEISDQRVELLTNKLKYTNRLQRLLLTENKIITSRHTLAQSIIEETRATDM